MNRFEDFYPVSVYLPADDEQAAIDALKARGLTKEDWESKVVGIVSFKNNVHKHMHSEQNGRCAYCRMYAPLSVSFGQREHIVAKNLHPQWTFEPQNLCYSCDRCNNFKSDEETLVDSEVTDYPQSGDAFKIINPFYDRWSTHIDLVGDIIYVGKTDKGKFTIKACHLYRSELALERARMKIEQNNSGSVVALLLSVLSKSPDAVEDVELVRTKVMEIVEKYKKYEQDPAAAEEVE